MPKFKGGKRLNASQRARRRERRMKKRDDKRRTIFEEAVDFDKVFSYSNLLNSSYICEKGVKWKKSTQIIGIYRLTQIGKLHKDLQNTKYHKRKAYKFLLRERGKIRNISGVSFRDRIVQRTLCDNSMKLIIERFPVYIFNELIKAQKKGQIARIEFFNTMLTKHLK